MSMVKVDLLNAYNELVPEEERFNTDGTDFEWKWTAIIEVEKDKATILRQPGYTDYAYDEQLDEETVHFFRASEPIFIESLSLSSFREKYPDLHQAYCGRIPQYAY